MTAIATKWDARRAETTRRLRWRALELTRDRGFDGWTMDDLAEAAQVSRRTVFNYFDSKAAVVIGPDPEVAPEALETFLAGGPHGRLLDDLLVLAAGALTELGDDVELARLARAVVIGEPALIALAHERFEALMNEAVDLVLQREGAQYGRQRAALLVRLLVTAYDDALSRIDPDGGRPFAETYEDVLADARALLA